MKIYFYRSPAHLQHKKRYRDQVNASQTTDLLDEKLTTSTATSYLTLYPEAQSADSGDLLRRHQGQAHDALQVN